MVNSVCRIAVLAVMMSSGAVVAQDAVKGVYLNSAELCAQAKKDGLQTVIEANNMILTNDGFEAIEFNCLFLQTVKHPGMPGWVVTSMCEEPDNAYPEMFSIVERRAGELDIAALTEVDRNAEPPSEQPEGGAEPGAQPDAAQSSEDAMSTGLSGTYFLCEGVERP